MSPMRHEWRLLLRSKPSLLAFAVLFALSALAVLGGLRQVERERNAIAHLAQLEQQDLVAQARRHGADADAGADPGAVAYYSFHGTWNPPSASAFLALGLRDTAPFAQRVRALALQAQLHEGEQFNPELEMAGRFDFAFVSMYLAPLFVIALLYNLVAGERQAGRLAMLASLPEGGAHLWLRRAFVRVVLLFACLALPLLGGAAASGMAPLAVAGVLLATAAYLAFWAGLALRVAAGPGRGAAHAIRLMGAWVLLTLVLPALAHAFIVRALPVRAGVELALAQRQAVHGAWDLPREATMERFFQSHPQWRGTAPLPAGFHWKWYYAFQQLGDEQVAPQVQAYREGMLARQRWTDRIGWVLPAVGVQASLHRQADTDLAGQLAYQDRIGDFHARLRAFYYPYLFEEAREEARRLRPADLDARPRFEAPASAGTTPLAQLLGLLAAAALMLAAGVRAMRRWGR